MYVVPDVSEFQKPLDGSFGRDAVIMRGAFGTWKADKNFLANATEAKRLWDAGRLRGGAVIYTVYLRDTTPAQQYAYLWNLIGPKAPPWLTGIMIDCEHWGGTSYTISGDHSAQLNTLYGLHAHRMGSWQSVKGYGNQPDLGSIWPHRDSRCDVVVAGYGSQLTYRNVRGAVGQQYTDGTGRWPHPAGLPTSSTPFGSCDHNVFPVKDGAGFRALWGRPGYATAKPPVTPKPPAQPPAHAPAGKVLGRSPDGTKELLLGNSGNVAVADKNGKILYYIGKAPQ
jgi:hypothetical protein